MQQCIMIISYEQDEELMEKSVMLNMAAVHLKELVDDITMLNITTVGTEVLP